MSQYCMTGSTALCEKGHQALTLWVQSMKIPSLPASESLPNPELFCVLTEGCPHLVKPPFFPPPRQLLWSEGPSPNRSAAPDSYLQEAATVGWAEKEAERRWDLPPPNGSPQSGVVGKAKRHQFS